MWIERSLYKTVEFLYQLSFLMNQFQSTGVKPDQLQHYFPKTMIFFLELMAAWPSGECWEEPKVVPDWL